MTSAVIVAASTDVNGGLILSLNYPIRVCALCVCVCERESVYIYVCVCVCVYV